jgi:hypothetical protein
MTDTAENMDELREEYDFSRLGNGVRGKYFQQYHNKENCMSTYELLKQAILQKKPVSAYYEGYYREMCPHALGTKDGEQRCFFYQYAGETSKGRVIPNSPANWRCMFVNKLSQVTILEAEWCTSDNHSRDQTCIDFVDVEVSRD